MYEKTNRPRVVYCIKYYEEKIIWKTRIPFYIY